MGRRSILGPYIDVGRRLILRLYIIIAEFIIFDDSFGLILFIISAKNKGWNLS